MEISQQEKEQFVGKLDEDSFRDKVVRRLFRSIGYDDGRDLCGPEEEGKDAVFVDRDKFGDELVTVVQTKSGNINLSSDGSKNLLNIVAQLRTALEQPFTCVRTKRKMSPSVVYLVASGRINNRARDHIAEQVRDPRIKFLDRDDLIAQVDQNCPELWFGIVAEVSPYLSALASRVDDLAFDLDANPVHSSIGAYIAAADNRYIDIKVARHVITPKKIRGKVIQDVDIDEMSSSKILDGGRKRILLMGDAGSGKSTLLVRLAYMLAKRGITSKTGYIVPTVVRAYDIARHEEADILRIITDITLRNYGISRPPFSIDDFETGRIALLVDGLDELADTGDRQRVVDLLNQFIEGYPACSLVLSTRPYVSISELEGIDRFQRFRLNPLDLEEASRMLSANAHASSRGDGWQREVLRKLDAVHGIELNPLLVTVFAISAGSDKRDIPANITELFSKFTELMLGRWDEKKGFAQQYQARLKGHILSNFAFTLQVEGRKTFSRDEFELFARKYLASINLDADLQVVIGEIVDRSGLLRGDSNELEFKHHLLQEFFAAQGVPSADFIKNNIGDEWWQNPSVFYFGAHPDSVEDLLDIASDPSVCASEAFVAVGLALQACYLSRLDDKATVWRWVVEGGAVYVQQQLAKNPKYPIMEFLQGYLYARDAVALSGIERDPGGIKRWIVEGLCPAATAELRRFWYVVALVELGRFDEVERFVQEHPFENGLLATGVHYGCYFASEVRLMDQRQRSAAQKTCDLLEAQVAPYRHDILREFKGQLLEYRRGGVVALDQDELS
jgi:hypothetical protein